MDLECLKVLFLTFCIPTLDTEKVKWLLGGKKTDFKNGIPWTN